MRSRSIRVGEGHASGPLTEGSKHKVTVSLPKDEWRSDKDPIIKGFRFRMVRASGGRRL
jgi:hypothetical protein